jgi:hypothetical protein
LDYIFLPKFVEEALQNKLEDEMRTRNHPPSTKNEVCGEGINVGKEARVQVNGVFSHDEKSKEVRCLLICFKHSIVESQNENVKGEL